MKEINAKDLLIKIFTPAIVLIVAYGILGSLIKIPHLLLFCLLGTVILVPIELGIILYIGKREYGTYTLKSALVGQEKLPIWQIIIIALAFFGMAGLFSAFIAPIENYIWADVRSIVLSNLPVGFDWTNYDYLKSFSRPMLIFTCIYYGIFNVFLGPITEELFSRGYLTSHYKKQNALTPILITILFSLYHFWLPFNNVFRILAFAPVAYVTYKKKNLYICMCFHCICNLFSTISFSIAVLG